MNPKFWRQLSRVHYLASLLFGIQVFIWVGTGLYFAAVPIETIRGEHLRAHPNPQPMTLKGLVSPEIAAASNPSGTVEISLRQINDRPVYLLTDHKGARTRIDAKTGNSLGHLTPLEAQKSASQTYIGKGELKSVRFYQKPPKEYAKPGPVYAVSFGPKDEAVIYVDALTSEAKTVRTPQWRLYDFLWGLHIMDWVNRDNFNSLHLLLFALGGVFLSLMGLGLTGLRLWREHKQSRHLEI